MAEAIVPEIIITDPMDPRLARLDWSDAGYEQSFPDEGEEPIYIVVPDNATNAALEKLAKRFQVPLIRLQRFRQALLTPDVQQQVPTNPRQSRAQDDEWFDVFRRSRRLYRVQGSGMAPRFKQNELLWGIPLDRPLIQDLEVIVHLKEDETLVRQINAVTTDAVELVDCYRCDRITIPRADIASIEVASHAHDVERCNRSEESKPLAIGCFVNSHIPQGIRHQQRGRQFIGPDRSRDQWACYDEATEASV